MNKEGMPQSNSSILPDKVHEKPPEILTPVDRFMLGAGFRKLYGRFSELGKDKFPQAMIFLDTSARPLAYGVKKIMEAICQKRNLPMPAIRFMVTHTPTETEEDLEELLYEDVVAWDDEEQRLKMNRKSMRARLEEILQEVDSKNIWIIDDTVSNGRTLQEVHRLFSGFPKTSDLRLGYFAFYDMSGEGTEEWKMVGREYLRGMMDGELHDLLEEKNREDGKPTFSYEDIYHYGGMSYRYGKTPSEDPDRKSRLVGLNKASGEKYAKPSSVANLPQMKQLRKEIEHLADEVMGK